MPTDKSPNNEKNSESKSTQRKTEAALRQSQALATQQKLNRQRLLIFGTIAILGLIIIGIIIITLPQPQTNPAAATTAKCDNTVAANITDPNQPPGQPVRASDAGLHLQHIDDTLPATYSSNPPATGWHFYQWAKPGPATNTIPDTMLVHNLEHGYVVIDYNYAPGQCPSLESKLATIANSYPKVISNPRPNPTASKIALTAWGRVENLDGYDETEIRRFITYWMSKPGNAPEWGMAP